MMTAVMTRCLSIGIATGDQSIRIAQPEAPLAEAVLGEGAGQIRIR
jgi:hypothetical protein